MKFPTKKYNYPKEYFKDYIYNFSNILDSNHYKELEKITNYLNLKIKAKKIFLYVEMADLLQLQIIFYVTLTKV